MTSTTAGPGPSPLVKSPEPDEIDRRRSLWCPAYESCLMLALRAGWRSWTCEHCVRFHDAGPHRRLAAVDSIHSRPGDGSHCMAPTRPALP